MSGVHDQAPRVAEAFPVGQHMRDEIAARGWSIAETARRMGVQRHVLADVLDGEYGLTTGVAELFATATDTTTDFWLRLQTTYTAWLAARDGG